MEFPRGLVVAERILAAGLALALGAVLMIESRSSAAAASRKGLPWPFWIEFPAETPVAAGAPGGPTIFLAVALPAQNALELVDFVGPRVSRKRAKAPPIERDEDVLSELLGRPGEALNYPVLRSAAPWRIISSSDALADAPPLEAKRLLLGRQSPLSLHSWMQALWKARGRRPDSETNASSIAELDRLVLALQLGRLKEDRLRTAAFPAEADAPAFFTRLLSASSDAARTGGPITIELLNASGASGFAFQATKILRSKGADVIRYANWPGPEQARTVIYDRAGRVDSALLVRRWLNCPSAEIMTEADSKKLIDVEAVLGRDCGPGHSAQGLIPWN